MADLAVPQLPWDDSNDPEYFEILGGRWIKKESVGRRNHSEMNLLLTNLLMPVAHASGRVIAAEWTMVHGAERVIPDVTVAFPNHRERDGYLVAPAYLVVESVSDKQPIRHLEAKCRSIYHVWGVPYCWILDLQGNAAYELHQDLQNGARLQQVDTLTAGAVIRLDAGDLYRRLHDSLQPPAVNS